MDQPLPVPTPPPNPHTHLKMTDDVWIDYSTCQTGSSSVLFVAIITVSVILHLRNEFYFLRCIETFGRMQNELTLNGVHVYVADGPLCFTFR